MKKLTSFFVSLGILLSLPVFVHAEEATGINLTSESVVTTTEISDMSYKYYFGQGCPHCAKVDEYLKGVDAHEKLELVKKEVYFNTENAAAMNADAEKLGIPIESLGVPFFIINDGGTESYLIGDKDIIAYLTPILGEPVPNNNKTIALIILGILAIVVPIFIIMGGKKG